jgi:hypothetical protein
VNLKTRIDAIHWPVEKTVLVKIEVLMCGWSLLAWRGVVVKRRNCSSSWFSLQNCKLIKTNMSAIFVVAVN